MVVQKAREQYGEMDELRAYGLLQTFQNLVQQWCKENGKDYDQWHKTTTAEWFFAEIKRVFGFERQPLSITL